ncbi:MAG: hypothetical protein ACRDV8_04045, partial [Acidimicrobiales bacterium]
IVGTYAPRGRSSTDGDPIVRIDDEKALRWLREGAKPTERVERLLRTSGTLDRFAGRTGEAPAPTPEAADDEAIADGAVDGVAATGAPIDGAADDEAIADDADGADEQGGRAPVIS